MVIRHFWHSAFSIDTATPRLEVVSYPDRELRSPQPLAAAGDPVNLRVIGEHVVFPALVEKRAPGPVEVDGESEREGFEAKSVRRAAVHKAETADAEREHAVSREAQILPRIQIRGLPRNESPHLRRVLISEAHRVAGERPVLAEDRRLAHIGEAERHQLAVREQ